MGNVSQEDPSALNQTVSAQDRLESWKGIAAYLNRDVRTVQRWEKQEGLPVRRHIHNKLSTVYAFKSELDRWWHDRKADLEEDAAEPETKLALSPQPRTALQRGIFVAATAAFLTSIVTVLLLWPGSKTTNETPLRRFAFTPIEPVVVALISPNGKHIAYITQTGERSQLWIQDLEGIEPRKIPGTIGAEFPFWSPDSRFLGYGTKTDLRTVALMNGDPVPICQLPEKNNPYLGGTWNPDGGSIVFTQDTRNFFEVAARGGTPRVLARLDPATGVRHVERPCFLPGPDKRLLFMFQEAGKGHDIGVFSPKTGKRETLGPGLLPSYGESGHVLFNYRSENWECAVVAAIPFSAASGHPTGDIFPIAANGYFPSESRDGTLVYVENTAHWAPRQLIWRDRNGKKLQIVGGLPPTALGFSLSPDGRRLVAYRVREPQTLVRDLTSGAEFALRTDSLRFGAVWTPDSKALAFAQFQKGNHNIVLQSASPGAQETVIDSNDRDEFPNDWSADGQILVYSVRNPATGSDLRYLKKKAGGGYDSHAFLETRHNEKHSKLSPDGRLLAYSSDELGRNEIFLIGFPEGTGKLRVSLNGGDLARWRSDGRELYYLENGVLCAVPVETKTELSVGTPKRLFEDRSLETLGTTPVPPFEVSADGQRFLLSEATGDAPRSVIRVVQNWYSEFRKKGK